MSGFGTIQQPPKPREPPTGGDMEQTLPRAACVRGAAENHLSADTLSGTFCTLPVQFVSDSLPTQINKSGRELTACTCEARKATEMHSSSSSSLQSVKVTALTMLSCPDPSCGHVRAGLHFHLTSHPSVPHCIALAWSHSCLPSVPLHCFPSGDTFTA